LLWSDGDTVMVMVTQLCVEVFLFTNWRTSE